MSEQQQLLSAPEAGQRVHEGGGGREWRRRNLLIASHDSSRRSGNHREQITGPASQRGVDRGSRHQAALPVAQAADPHLLSRNWLYWDRQPTVVRWTFVQFVQRAPRFGK